MFVLGTPFQPGLIFVGMKGAPLKYVYPYSQTLDFSVKACQGQPLVYLSTCKLRKKFYILDPTRSSDLNTKRNYESVTINMEVDEKKF